MMAGFELAVYPDKFHGQRVVVRTRRPMLQPIDVSPSDTPGALRMQVRNSGMNMLRRQLILGMALVALVAGCSKSAREPEAGAGPIAPPAVPAAVAPAAPPTAAQPPASASVSSNSAVQVFIDPATGQSRAPTAQEWQEM